jgi:transcriptional regulator with XRE-family HTH domain
MLGGMYGAGEVIRQARERRGWGQRRLAEVSGVAQPNIAAIEAGSRVPSLAMVGRLVRACGLRLRFDLEPCHADVDTEVATGLEREPLARMARTGWEALTTASRLAMKGVRLVLDGPLAARLVGAPVTDGAERVWCEPADLGLLREAVARCHLKLRPVVPRYDEDGRMILSAGDEMRIGGCRVRLGSPPPAPWAVSPYGEPLLVVGVNTLLAYPWSPPDRVAVHRLAAALADRGESGHGLDTAP